MKTFNSAVRPIALFIAALALHNQAYAQNRNNSDNESLEEVTVHAHPLYKHGASQDIKELTGDALEDALESSLGETVAKQAGVRSASFGGAVGRPVIHGLGGARVKTTEDRIDSLDVSVTSTDHAVTVEPFIANRVTILKGASSLVYGSGAIGGIVDIETGRIPTKLPKQELSGKVELRAADNADARTAAARLDGKASDSLAWHIDAFSKQADDYDFGRQQESPALLELEGETPGEDGGTLLGSRYDLQGGSVGATWFSDSLKFGASVSAIDGGYGLIGSHGHEDEDEDEEHEGSEEEHLELESEEEPPTIELKQTRVDLWSQLVSPFSGVEKIDLRLAINDYEHQEIEEDGVIATRFENDAWEGRIEVTHAETMGFTGSLGLQVSERDFSALGEEAFVPPTTTETTGVFWVGERQFNNSSLELGLRAETVETSPIASNGADREFELFSTSVGAVIPTSETITWSALLDYSERAPSIEELYSNGVHLATQSFELGDSSLEKESALGLTLSFAYQTEHFDMKASLYRTQFNDFIYQQATGLSDESFPVFLYQHDDATFLGIDLEIGTHLTEIAGGDVDLSLVFDSVKAELDQNKQPLPRIPASRVGLSLAWQNDVWRAKLNLSKVGSQTDVAELELPTQSYTDIGFKVERDLPFVSNNASFFVQGKNITDEEQRSHTSFIKDVTPAPGRRFELGLRLSF